MLDDPQGPGTASFHYTAYDTAGTKIADDDYFTSDHLNVIGVDQLVSGESFGTVVFDFSSSGGGFATARYSAAGRFSLELNAACLDE